MENPEERDQESTEEKISEEDSPKKLTLASYPEESEEESDEDSLLDRISRLEKAYDDLLSNKSTPFNPDTGIVHSLGESDKRELPQVNSLKPTRAMGDVPTHSSEKKRPKDRWFFIELVAELRSIVRMYLDFRYRLTWFTKLMGPILVGLILINSWFVGNVLLIGWIVEPVLNVLLIYVLVKVLTREATRYRETSLDIPPSLRL